MFDTAAYQREWARKNWEKVQGYKRRFRDRHRVRIAADRRAHRAKHRAKLDAAKQAWAKKHPELVAMQAVRKRIKAMNAKINSDLQYHYEITLKKYNQVLAKQGGVCAICKKLELTKRTRRLTVDHDHATGKIRGLLCHRCNCGLGYFKDDPVHIQKALDYLRRGQWSDE